MQAREFGAAAHTETAARGNPGPGSFKSKKPTAVIATPDLDLWAQLGPMLESTVAMRHADSLQSAAAMLKPGTRTILLADLRGLSPDDFAPISASAHNPVVIAIRDGASAGMVFWIFESSPDSGMVCQWLMNRSPCRVGPDVPWSVAPWQEAHCCP